MNYVKGQIVHTKADGRVIVICQHTGKLEGYIEVIDRRGDVCTVAIADILRRRLAIK